MPQGGSRLAACLASAALALPPSAAQVDTAGVLAQFWAAHRAGSPELPKLAARLDHVVRTELGPSGEPVRDAARLLAADPARAWAARTALIGAQVPDAQRVFVTAAVREYDDRYAVPSPTASTTLGHYRGHGLALASDGDTGTYYWSAAAATTGATVTVDLGRVRPIREVRLALGKPDRPRDYVHQGVLEFSVDGHAWYTVARLSAPDQDIPVRADARHLRLRSTADQRHWLVIREVAVVTAPEDACADGDPATVFTVTGTPVEVPLRAERTPRAVVVRAGADTPPGGAVQVRADGAVWRTLGALAGPYTELPVRGVRVSRVRIVPPGDSTPVGVHEVSVRPAG